MLNQLKSCKNKIQTMYLLKFINRPYMKISQKMESMYKQSDKVSKSYELIYRHPQVSKISFMYHSVNFLTFMSISQIVHMHYKGLLSQVIQTPIEFGLTITFIGFIFLMSQKLRNGFPIRIYYNEQKRNNIAIFLGKIPFTSEHYEFPSNSVTPINKNSQFAWKNSTFQSNNRRIFLLEENFKTYNNFYNMLKFKNNEL